VPGVVGKLTWLLGYLVDDVILTGDEIKGLMAGLLFSEDPPKGRVRLTEWLRENAQGVGTRYASELERHYR
jgi:NADH dehydrogenase